MSSRCSVAWWVAMRQARSVSARLLPAEVAGRNYRPSSAVLETTWRAPAGELTLTEGMVAHLAGSPLPPGYWCAAWPVAVAPRRCASS